MNPYLVLALEAVLFALGFGTLSWLREEGLPSRFAWEVIGLAAIILVPAYAMGISVHPVLFLVIIYIATMRARLLVDLANAFCARKRYEAALSVLRLALRLSGDAISETLVHINTGVVLIRQQRYEEAASLLLNTLPRMPEVRGGPKYEAACRYNLGLAYLRAGEEGKAVEQFNAVIAMLPNSLYARGAEAALRRRAGEQSDRK